ncbi:hypothetical protein LASUN_13520 [Lentilactobacillus sunkii]|jgi:hypothetical protein|uniref:Uncharacterized protein n=1 Tax=Lentilactobacillus sunkii TaxID=481719 RepID=A0A1E7XCW2_9LACO|nr:hypothetical protein [Lentilactobacillus sunkii]OFA10802.1 hypothetical protein LASUN_13520 [Lentilactobacillus sunkii]
MKIKQELLLGITSLSFGGLIAFSHMNTGSVQASSMPSFDSSYWYKARTVHVRRTVYASQINPKSWTVRQRRVLKVGSKIRIFNSANLGWVVKSPMLHQFSGYTWVVKGHYNTNWITK